MDPVSPGSIGQIFDSFGTGMSGQIAVWSGYLVISAAILGAIWYIMVFFQYKYKVHYPILHYSEDGKSAQIVGWKKDKAKNTKKNGNKRQQLFFKRKHLEPFTTDMIHHGNNVFLLKINDDGTFLKFPYITFTDHISKFEVLTPEEKRWAIQELKENARLFQDTDAAKRILFYTVISIGLCLGMVIFTVWLCLKAPNKAAEALNAIAPTLNNFLSRVGPGGVVP